MKRFVMVTGASRGLGLALAKAALPYADTLLVVARHPSAELQALATQSACELRFEACDLSDCQQIDQLCQGLSAYLQTHAFDEYWQINNAGTLGPMKQFNGLARTSAQTISQAFNLNVVQVMRLCSCFLEATQDRLTKVVNISSGAAHRATEGWGVYCASKAALDMYTKVAQSEVQHAKLVAMAPGVVDTDMQANIRRQSEEDFPNIERFLRLHAEHELRSPQEVALAIIEYMTTPEFGDPIIDHINNII
ncbi:SDR family NAD(P)-dependent oxidoreductase [Brackiella oedipodis]|uniref:SDR family NAD(P)-dependent oxidoreductase n=1 Tax=Brackiella oedipodis TaxID=124225 RepID=UPI0004910C3B|nr:SDR family NAD(P)-dependent oxidoreductase [Brackiella oedipodis]